MHDKNQIGNYFLNSVTITEEQVSIVNDNIINHIQNVKNYLKELKIEGELFLTGSLSRKEPTIKLIDNMWEISSDYDFVLIVSEYKENENLLHITQKINKHFINTNNSFIVLEKSNLQNIKSLVARDIVHNIQENKYTDIIVKDINVHSQDYFEAFISPLAVLVTYPDKISNKILYKNEKSYYVYKSIFEGFKAIVKCKTIKELVGNKKIESIINHEKMLELIYLKEHSIYDEKNRFDYEEILDLIILVLFNNDNIVSWLKKLDYCNMNFIRLFQFFIIVRFYVKLRDYKELKSLYNNLLKLIKIEEDDVTALIHVREKYLREVYKKNMDTDFIPDLEVE